METPTEEEDEAKSVVSERPPNLTVEVLESYEQALFTGSYLLSKGTGCVGIHVTEGKRLTVNIKLRYCPTSFFVGGAQGENFEEDFGFDVSE